MPRDIAIYIGQLDGSRFWPAAERCELLGHADAIEHSLRLILPMPSFRHATAYAGATAAATADWARLKVATDAVAAQIVCPAFTRFLLRRCYWR